CVRKSYAKPGLDPQFFRKWCPRISRHRLPEEGTAVQIERPEAGAGSRFFLLHHRRVISSPRPHLEILSVVGHDLNRAKVPVRLEVRRLVRYVVLAAQLFL